MQLCRRSKMQAKANKCKRERSGKQARQTAIAARVYMIYITFFEFLRYFFFLLQHNTNVII